ncbi:denticleless protein homolog [Trichechus inunguis]
MRRSVRLDVVLRNWTLRAHRITGSHQVTNTDLRTTHTEEWTATETIILKFSVTYTWQCNRFVYRDVSVVCGKLSRSLCLVTVRSSQSTPAKAPRVKSSSSISSPSSAACAPSCTGDLPLPSNTPTFSAKPSPAKAQSPVSRKGSGSSISPKPPPSLKMSIRNWITQTPSSSPPVTPPASETRIPSPRKALIPVSQKPSQAMACSESRNRVKRRLDSSCLENGRQKCVKSCSCVTELDGQVEKLRLDLCCLAGNQDDLGKSSEVLSKLSRIEGTGVSVSEPPSPASPYASEGCGALPLPLRSCGQGSEVAGKENSSPENKNWLVAMSAKRKAENSSPRSPSSQTASSRRQSGKTSPGPVTMTPSSMRKICTYFHRKSQEHISSPEQST